MMGGGAVGYVLAGLCCATIVAFFAGSTAVLYLWAGVRRRRGLGEAAATVSSLEVRPAPEPALPPGGDDDGA
jgi:hypothetical protein